jgi:hypothetical protein
VGLLGVIAGQQRQPCDRVLVDHDLPYILTDAAALGQVLEDRDRLLVRELGVEQRGTLELGESSLTGIAVEEAVARRGKAIADGEVGGIAIVISRAFRVLAGS